MNGVLNEHSLDTLCAALCYAIGIEPPAHAAAPSPELMAYVDAAFGGKKADRLLMFNPDAVAEWLFEKYPPFFGGLGGEGDLKLPLRTAMPSVTPVCFGTMYTGAQPAVHGITKYEKRLIEIDSFFDACVRAGKKVALVSHPRCSMGVIFLEREIDYFLYPSWEKINAKAAELIVKDEYDVIVVYNGNYDGVMHKTGTESCEALAELRANVHAFKWLDEMVAECWQGHNTLLGFAMDHGCHDIDGDAGSHGLDMVEDLNILHVYRARPKETE
ncbi:MAG: hypothetical protein IJW51_03100 [Clostridia bacterium]|nr:hypothetical protein [Clostridia bacterium]